MKHGTVSGYCRHSCRCEPCRAAMRAYRRENWPRWRKLRKVSAERAREHIRMLSAHGLGSPAIADACDVNQRTIRWILSGRQRLIYRRTAERILGVTPEAIADGALVPAEAAHRRIRELREEGYSLDTLGRELGIKPRSVLEYFRRDKITARTNLRISKIYRRLVA